MQEHLRHNECDYTLNSVLVSITDVIRDGEHTLVYNALFCEKHYALRDSNVFRMWSSNTT